MRMKSSEGAQRQRDKAAMVKSGMLWIGTFFVPVLLWVLILAKMQITYGGKLTLLTYDMHEQYMPFLASLRYVLDGTNSPFFSWGIALGANYGGLITYYVSSPLSWIACLFELKDMPEAVYVITLLKIGLCGLHFALFARYGLAPEKKIGIAHVVFASCYALMSYNIMYSMCIMWLDGVLLFPLVLLGVEEIVRGKRGCVYFAAITALFVCNYYTAYMIGIFTAVYMVCRVLGELSKDVIKASLCKLVRFGVVTLLALGVAMPVLLMAINSISLGKATEAGIYGVPPEAYSFTIAELLQKLLPGMYDSLENAGLPSIYCGSIMLGLAIAYFFQKKHGWKKKVLAIALLAVPVAGFLVPQVDYIYHAFNFPTAFPYRYAYLFSMVVLILAWHALCGIKIEESFRKLLCGILVCYTFVELFFNGFHIVTGIHGEVGYKLRFIHDRYVENTQPLIEEVKSKDGFVRTDVNTATMAYNGGMFYGINSASGFTSTYNRNVNSFMMVLGAESKSFYTEAKGLTLVGDSLLGMKYRIDGREERPGYETISESEANVANYTTKMYLHENPYALSLGYMVPFEKLFDELTLTMDVYQNHNIILETLGCSNTEVFKEVDYVFAEEEEKYTIEFVMPTNEILYCYVNADENLRYIDEETGESKEREKTAIVTVRGEGQEAVYGEVGENICINCFEVGEKVTIEITGEHLDYHDTYLYALDMQVFEDAYEELAANELEVSSYNEGCIVGSVCAGEDEVLFTTIPADGNYRVKVDGVESEYYKVLATFVAIPLAKGEHEIEITYISPGFEEGVRIFVVSTLLSILYFTVKCKKKCGNKGKASEASVLD